MYMELDIYYTYSEGCDDKSGRGSEVLVAIDVHGVGHLHDTVVEVAVPVVAQLFLPLKVVHRVTLKCITQV